MLLFRPQQGAALTRIISIANQKGGVGKTTTAINLSRTLSLAGRETLLIDMDPQCNATTGFGERPAGSHPLAGPAELAGSIRSLKLPHLSLLPGSRSFRDADHLATADGETASRVIRNLKEGTLAFEYVVIDLPPSLGQLTRTALAASSEVLMPIQCEFFAMEGLAQMIEIIREIIRKVNSQLDFAGILLTMYDESLEITQEVDQQVREFFGEIVFQTVIPRDVSLSEAPSHGKSVLDYAPRSRAARAYTELGMELLAYEYA